MKDRTALRTSCASSGERLAVPDLDCSERYGTLLTCGGLSLLFTRWEGSDGDGLAGFYWATLLRTRPASSNGSFSLPIVSLPASWNMSHNAAFACGEEPGTVLAYGGRRRRWGRLSKPFESGIIRALGRLTETGGVHWERPALVLSPTRHSCREDRSSVERTCEFDGKLSLVPSFGGQQLLYARANLGEAGGRHVQVSRSTDGGLRWSPFELLTIDGVTLEADNNIYFFNAHLGSAQHGAQLLGLMPAVLDGVGGVYLSRSSDGVAWSRPRRLLESEPLGEGRTVDHPVHGIGLDASETLRFYVQHSIELGHGPRHDAWPYRPGLRRPCEQEGVEPFICAYDAQLPQSSEAPRGEHARRMQRRGPRTELRLLRQRHRRFAL